MAKKTLSAIVIDALEDIKARDIQLLNVSRITSIFDYIVIASADSTRQTRALANNVVTKVKEAGFYVIGTEGEGSGEWVLVDCGDIVVHIMQPAVREYYKLEELWREGKLEFPRPRTAKPMPKAGDEAKAPAKARKASAKISTRGTASAVAAKAKADAAAGVVAKKKPAVKKTTAGSKTAGVTAAAKEPVAKKPAVKKALAIKPVAKKPTAKKPAAKSPVAKKPAVKKPVAKKPAAKKPVAKKPAARKPPSNKRSTKTGA